MVTPKQRSLDKNRGNQDPERDRGLDPPREASKDHGDDEHA